jgi:hypothetical protein
VYPNYIVTVQTYKYVYISIYINIYINIYIFTYAYHAGYLHIYAIYIYVVMSFERAARAWGPPDRLAMCEKAGN